MYSNKQNVNILTALLVAHGVRHAVVCPGSRNAPIVHNLNECPDIACYPVTDERSAGFYALGMAQIVGQPVVVCVTSGTALLNLAPAVAEACYQHVPLVVVSGDRPAMWIDQQDGQTLPQKDALGRFVRKAVSLPEPTNDDERWYCNRLVNEALLSSKRKGCSPVHINVPITEPLFQFDIAELPCERMLQMIDATEEVECYRLLEDTFFKAKRPMIVVGQMPARESMAIVRAIQRMQTEVVVVYECLSMSRYCYQGFTESYTEGVKPLHVDKVIDGIQGDEAAYQPDAILYVGGEIISKKLKQFLRRCADCQTWIVNREGCVYDTFMNLYGVIEGRPTYVLENVETTLNRKKQNDEVCFDKTFYQRWQQSIRSVEVQFLGMSMNYSQLLATKELLGGLAFKSNYILHAANSMSVRLVNLFAADYVYCNRGVNGIEGSLSAAAGSSLVTQTDVYCVIGDLSFFYDQNALWHQLGANFKVLLLNNGGGGIFRSLPGLKHSAAHQPLISAQHQTSARGICQQNNVEYLSASNESELRKGMDRFINADFKRPVVFEVFTSQAQDEQAMDEYYQA